MDGLLRAWEMGIGDAVLKAARELCDFQSLFQMFLHRKLCVRSRYRSAMFAANSHVRFELFRLESVSVRYRDRETTYDWRSSHQLL